MLTLPRQYIFSTCIILSVFACWGCVSVSLIPKPPLIDNDSSYVQLPNGWKLRPVGAQVTVGEFPMNLITIKDGRYALTSNSGMGENAVSVIDLKKLSEVNRTVIDRTWRGLAFDEQSNSLFVSGSNNNSILIYTFKSGNLNLADSIVLGARYPKEKIGVSGLCFSAKRGLLFAAARYAHAVYVIQPSEKKLLNKIDMPDQCYDILLNADESKAYVSVWGAAEVGEININEMRVARTFRTGDHPCEMLFDKSGERLFVANANTNSVSVIDLANGREAERITSSLLPDLPPGSTPNALCLNESGTRLYIANADNNCLAVFDVNTPGRSRALGFIPTGWYPTAVKVTEGKLIIANGKGGASRANPDGPNPYQKDDHGSGEYIGSLFKGTVTVIEEPDDEELSVYTGMVYKTIPLKRTLQNAQSVISVTHNGASSPAIEHVFYIIKENRTYDQVFGDMPGGNGDTALCLFPANVTPNQHKLVSEFTLFDNFYVDAEISADGHNWSTAAYATDYVEKIWPVYYGGKGGAYEFEGGFPIAAPSSGYIWDAAMKAGKRVRLYGEFVKRNVQGNDTTYSGADERLTPIVCATYPGWDMGTSDLYRAGKWKEDFDELAAKDSVPHLSVIRLPNNHTVGTRKGALSPTAYVAQNDYALGQIVEHLSKSKYWKKSIVLVVEDDAQNGADHVDAHRSCLLAIGPFVKRNFTDHTMYSTSGVLKTIELILGLPPMTQHDLFAMPMVNCLTDSCNASAFVSVIPEVDLEERNPAHGYGANECEEMNFAELDAVPDRRFNEILWKALKGEHSSMPAPVRCAFVRSLGSDDEDFDE